MRGKRTSQVCPSEMRRITPAGAGKTSARFRPAPQVRDHPRRCGENEYIDGFAYIREGSPPQVRGKLRRWIHGTLHKQDHPRRCGENGCGGHTDTAPPGSPPQVRGKLRGLGRIVPQHGITPAGAGKTTGVGFFSCPFQDHPRRCGENAANTYIEDMNLGSPPQVRGKRKDDISGEVEVGITPAGAGKTA